MARRSTDGLSISAAAPPKAATNGPLQQVDAVETPSSRAPPPLSCSTAGPSVSPIPLSSPRTLPPPSPAAPATPAAAAAPVQDATSGISKLAIAALFLAWGHGWIAGLTHEHSSSRTFKLYGLAAIPVVFFVCKNPIGRRFIAATVFALLSAFVMAVTSSVAWYRNPKHAGHLPDLIHDMVPYIDTVTIPYTSWLTASGEPWSIAGLELAEGLMSGLILTTLTWVLTQPWRWLVLRRAFIIYGTLAWWRSVTILVTAVPDASPRCSMTTPGTIHFYELPYREALYRGLSILVGDLTDPCRSAGDMVFSGHTMVVVLCGMIWHVYYRVKPGTFVPNPVKMVVWAVIGVILFLIVGSRYHYTLDVILAVYFAITIFNAYHRVADDVLIGHRFVAVWLFDGLIIYPAIEWLEAPALGEATRVGMVSRNTRLMNQLQAARAALDEAGGGDVPMSPFSAYTPTPSHQQQQQQQQQGDTTFASASPSSLSTMSAAAVRDGLGQEQREATAGTPLAAAAVGLVGILSPSPRFLPHRSATSTTTTAGVTTIHRTHSQSRIREYEGGAAALGAYAPSTRHHNNHHQHSSSQQATPHASSSHADTPHAAHHHQPQPPPAATGCHPACNHEHLCASPLVASQLVYTLPRATFGADGGMDFTGYQYAYGTGSGSSTRSVPGQICNPSPAQAHAHAHAADVLSAYEAAYLQDTLHGGPGSGETADEPGVVYTLLARALNAVTGGSGSGRQQAAHEAASGEENEDTLVSSSVSTVAAAAALAATPLHS